MPRTPPSDPSKNRPARDCYDKINVILLFLAFVAAIAAAVGVFRQANIFSGQLTEMKKVYGPVKDSADAAKIAAKASEQSVEAIRDQTELDQRAWLGVEFIRSDPSIPEIGKTFIVEVQIKNSGKTPARKIVSRGRGEPILKGSKPNFSYDGVEQFSAFVSPGAVASTTVAPVTIPQTNQSIVFNDDIIKGLTTETFKVFVHGRFDYEDIFGNPHWVTYCAYLVVPFNGKFGFCAEHNDSDDYRPKK